MSWKYNFIDHTADIAVEVKGDTIEELFTASAFAWRESVIEKDKINLFDQQEINIYEISYEELLVHFLDELNYLFLTRKWIMSGINKIEIQKKNDKLKLKAIVTGESYNDKRHQLKVEIKAVTFHQMEIKKVNNEYFTRIIFDI
jgi:SHS2 domain-containing protein